MRRVFCVFAVSLALVLSGCGDVHFFFNPGTTVSGAVSQIHLTIADDGGVSVQVTIVTFFTQTGATDVTFCGNQVNRFPPNQQMQVTFTPGTVCASNIVVHVTG